MVLETEVYQVKRFDHRYIFNLYLKKESKLKCLLSEFYSLYLSKH